MLKNNLTITAEPLINKIGAYIQINNLLVEVKQADDKTGYIIDIFNNDKEELIDTITVWNDDL